jgi:hypothetical protein
MLQKPVTRRTLLKAILAGSGGIAAASFLPEKWLKPVVHSGVLPVHAQSSGYSIQGYRSPVGAHVYTGSVTHNPNGSYKMASPIKTTNPPSSPGNPVNGVTVTASVTSSTGPTPMTITSSNPQVTGTGGTNGWAGFSINPGDGGILRFTAASGVYNEVTINNA